MRWAFDCSDLSQLLLMFCEVEGARVHVLRSNNQILVEEPRSSSVNKHIQLSFLCRAKIWGKRLGEKTPFLCCSFISPTPSSLTLNNHKATRNLYSLSLTLFVTLLSLATRKVWFNFFIFSSHPLSIIRPYFPIHGFAPPKYSSWKT